MKKLSPPDAGQLHQKYVLVNNNQPDMIVWDIAKKLCYNRI